MKQLINFFRSLFPKDQSKDCVHIHNLIDFTNPKVDPKCTVCGKKWSETHKLEKIETGTGISLYHSIKR